MHFVCVRIPQFPAWALAQVDPNLASQPFVVCENGYVVAASPGALEAGICDGITVGKATSRLSSLIIVSRDKSCEAIAWHEVQYALYGVTPKVEPLQNGLLFCEVNSDKITALLRHWNHGGFRVCAGSASDRATAHIAALQASGGSCRNIKRGAEWSYAGKVPLTELKGEVSSYTLQCLHWFGWSNLSAIRQLNRRQLQEQFDGKGKEKDGLKLYRFAQGAKCRENLRPVLTWQPPEIVAKSIEFELPAREPRDWNQGLVDILIAACVELGPRSAHIIEVTAHMPITSVSSRRLIRESSNNPKTLIGPLQNTLEEALRSVQPLPIIVSGFEIRLGGLSVPDASLTLWEDPHATRHKKLQCAIERIEERLPGKLRTAVIAQPHSPFEEEIYHWNNALEQLSEERYKGGRNAHSVC